MNATGPRPHLVERVVEAMRGGTGLLEAPPPAPTRSRHTPDDATPPRTGSPAPKPAPAPAALPAVSLEQLHKAGAVSTPGNSRTRVSEEYSIIQHGVLRIVDAEGAASPRSRVVLVTSARPGEGKSFSAINLAASLATASMRRVVLVDTDAKRNNLSHLLGLGDRPGLAALAADPARPGSDLLVGTAIERLRVLPNGRPSTSSEAPSAVAAAIIRLAVRMPDHLLILDAPPCLSTSDPGSLATIAGQVVMIVEAERTPRNELEAALDLVEACPTLHLLLNRTRLDVTDTFGAYYGGYYDGT